MGEVSEEIRKKLAIVLDFDDLVRVSEIQELTEIDRTHLELLFQLGALATGGCRLVERRLSLLRCEGGRKRHARTLLQLRDDGFRCFDRVFCPCNGASDHQ